MKTRSFALCCAAAWTFAIGTAQAVAPKKASSPLDQKQFTLRELRTSSESVPLDEVIDRLPNQAAWRAFAASRAAEGAAVHVFIDPRSGAATNIVRSVPLIPGSGVGNRITLQALGQGLGRQLTGVDAKAVGEATLGFVRASHGLLGIDPAQLGEVRASRVTPDLWDVSIPQQYLGVRVRDAWLLASIGHGNLVTVGAVGWSKVSLPNVVPTLGPEDALKAGFAYAGGRTAEDELVGHPALEIVRVAVPEHPADEAYAGPIGRGHGHRLVWTFVFRRSPEMAQWEVMVDAHRAEVIVFKDRSHHARRHVTGGVYPFTNTDTCPNNQTCGAMQSAWPMPFADTGFPVPHDFSNSAGVFDFTDGSGATTLRGRYIDIRGFPQGLHEGSVGGAISLYGANRDHDFTSSGTSPGNTAAARTAFYEMNKIAEMARGYLPDNERLQQPLITLVNADEIDGDVACNAGYYPAEYSRWPPYEQIAPAFAKFLRSGEHSPGRTCRNTGEIAAVLDHEWGHGMDDNDSSGFFSDPSEAYADVAAIYRTQASCVGTGMFQSNHDGCGTASDGTGANPNMVFDGTLHCATDCSGVREADWAKHAPNTPDVAADFVFHCIKNVDGHVVVSPHCMAAPVDQAAWDLVTRDLTAPPFNYDSQTAFIVGNKLFYQGSGKVRDWYFWRGGSEPTSYGCSNASGYIGWLVADDDNGDLTDGTPHMTALYNAFDRHGIACASIPPVNSGCAGGPSGAPSLTATPGHYQVNLAWSSVPGATRYWVFRTEGHAGCNYGKALIAETTSRSYTDTEVAAGRPYYYNVVAAGSSSACFGPASACVSATPTAGSYTVSCTPSSLFAGEGGSTTTTCKVTSTGGYDSAVSLGCTGLPSGGSCSASPASVIPAPNGSLSTVTVSPGLASAGTYPFKFSGWPPAQVAGTHTSTATLTVLGTGDQAAAFDPALFAPRCSAVGRSCDTGSLVTGRAGSEPNAPNTINRSCADGTGNGTGFIDRVRVFSVSGANFAAGAVVTLSATVPSMMYVDDAVDFFHAADARDPQWTYIATATPGPAAPGSPAVTLGASYRLLEGGLQAVRVQYRRGGSAVVCAAGPLNDRDDLVFAVE